MSKRFTCAARERRKDSRLLCSELVRLIWVDGPLQGRSEFAVLENVSAGGASVLAGVDIADNTRLRIVSPQAEFKGAVRSCNHIANGYLVSIAFDPDCRWSESTYVPEHLLDPRNLETGEPER